MGIFNEFFKKEKPVFTGLKFGFGSGGGGAAGPSVTVSGGTKIPGASTPDGFDYFVFTSDDNLVISGGSADVDLMLVAGGGGGGGRLGGGGGGGGYLYLPNISYPEGTFAVDIGAGGAADPVTFPNASQGTVQRGAPTTIAHPGGAKKAWGGGGGSADNSGSATYGGSGGGGAGNNGGTSKPGLTPDTPTIDINAQFPGQPFPSPRQGYPGSSVEPGGGGGAGAAGSGRNGGVGKVGDIPLPASYGTPGPSPGRWFAGGGGGSGWPGGSNGTGGAGGGGGASGQSSDTPGTAGTANTGGGGGAGGQNGGDSGAGGSGIVAVRVRA